MNERPPKLNPPLVELIPIPPPGTVTGVSSGAAALVPIEWLREINTKGVRPGELAVLLDELEDQAEEDVVSAWPDDTGLPNAIKIIPGNPDLGSRLRSILPTVLLAQAIGLGFYLVKRRDRSTRRDPAGLAARCLPPRCSVSYSNSSNITVLCSLPSIETLTMAVFRALSW
jgi:hypothetical protein